MFRTLADLLICCGAWLLEYGLGGSRLEPRLAPIRARSVDGCFHRQPPQ